MCLFAEAYQELVTVLTQHMLVSMMSVRPVLMYAPVEVQRVIQSHVMLMAAWLPGVLATGIIAHQTCVIMVEFHLAP